MATRRVTIQVFGDDAQFKQMVEAVKAMKKDLADAVKIKIKTENDTGDGGRSGLLGRLLFGRNDSNGSSLLGKVNGLISKIPYIGSAISKLGPVALPVLGALAATAVALIGYIGSMASDLVAAGMGMAAFGALALPTFSKITAAIAGTKGAMKGLTPVQKQIVDGAKQLHTEWDKMAKAFAPALTPIMKTLLDIAQKALPHILPFAESAARAINGLLKDFERFGNSSAFKSFMSQMLKFSGPTITAVGKGLLQVGGALTTLLRELASPQGIIAIRAAFTLLAGTIRLVGVAMQYAIKVSTLWGNALFDIARIGVQAAKAIGDAFLATWAVLLRGMSHIPGLGFLKGWATSVANWQHSFDNSMNGAIGKLNQWQTTFKNMPKVINLQANISDLQAKLATAEALLKNPDLTKTRRANIEANISALRAQIAMAKIMLNSINGTTATTYINTVYANSRGHAAGTMNSPPGWFWVGEQGPELMRFGGGEQVLPSPVSMAVAGMSAPAPMGPAGITESAPINIYVSGDFANPDATAKRIQTVLVDLKRRRGGVALGLA